MAEVTTIARPYAEAVFALADSGGTLDQWSTALSRLAAVVNAPEISQLLGNPHVTDTQMADLITSASGDIPVQARQFLQILVSNKRLSVLPEVASMYERLKTAREGAVDADIASAFPLDGSELAALVSDLERRFQRKVRPHVRVDPELIGGARISVGDQVIDGSVRGKLAAMRIGLAS